MNQHFASIAIGGAEGPPFGLEVGVQHTQKQRETDKEHLPKSPSLLTEDASTPSSISDGDEAGPTSHLLHDTIESTEIDCSTENPGRLPELQSPPIKNEFDYGGFVESPLPQDIDNTLRRSSPWSIPDDFSTPQNGHHADDIRRRRYRPLPRSPLFLSQNATSPDGRVTTRLAPRVVSQVATYNSPGIIFTQPPRRPPRTTPRPLRHQTNSFSFDSSERVSAAYEQERVISTSTDDTIPHPSEDVSLHDELRGSSLQSSRVSSIIPTTQEIQSEDRSEAEKETPTTDREFIFSSPGFPLPPPFSSVSRRTSNTDSLPSITRERLSPERLSPNLATSPIRSLILSPDRGEADQAHASPNKSTGPATSETSGSPPPGGRIGNFINRIARMASYRTRSPVNRGTSPASSTSTPPHSQSRQTSATMNPQTPSRSYRVYNDDVSPDMQPQTPANLPEARHQSRYHPSYTAPVTTNTARHGASSTIGTDRTRNLARPREPLYTPVRGRRTDSPSGMRDVGFEGLYGGRENGNDEQSWADGVRFNNAETRFWGERNARNNEGALRETPEPEDWRVGRRD